MSYTVMTRVGETQIWQEHWKFWIGKFVKAARGSCLTCSMVAYDLLVKPDMFVVFFFEVWGCETRNKWVREMETI